MTGEHARGHGGPVVRARGVGKLYRLDGVEVRALAGVDLTIAPGDSLAIMGPSGSGKSTLLGLLGGLDRPTEGRLELEGTDILELSDDRLAELRNRVIGFVFQNFQLLGRTPAVANVGLPLVYRGVGRGERLRRAAAALEAVGLGHRLDHRPSQLSGGEQQRVAIARALVTEPRMLLADEPTGNLDSRSGDEVLRLLLRLHDERGVAVVVVTHDREVASRFGRMVTVRDGRVTDPAGNGPPDSHQADGHRADSHRADSHRADSDQADGHHGGQGSGSRGGSGGRPDGRPLGGQDGDQDGDHQRGQGSGAPGGHGWGETAGPDDRRAGESGSGDGRPTGSRDGGARGDAARARW